MRIFHSLLLLLPLVGHGVAAAAQSSSAPSSSAAADPTSSSTVGASTSQAPTTSAPGSSSKLSRTTTSKKPSAASATIPGPSSGTNYGPKGPPDVLLRVPELHVGRISLDVDNLRAEINLAAEVASLVTLNAGVQVGIDKVNVTIVDVDAQLDLVIRLGNLVKVVNRTLSTLDANPALINLLDGVVDAAVDGVSGVVGGGGGGGGGGRSTGSAGTVAPTSTKGGGDD